MWSLMLDDFSRELLAVFALVKLFIVKSIGAGSIIIVKLGLCAMMCV